MGKSKLLTSVRERIHRLNYSYKTERAYISWIIRYIKHHGTVHPAELGERDVEKYLNYLANERHVSAVWITSICFLNGILGTVIRWISISEAIWGYQIDHIRNVN